MNYYIKEIHKEYIILHKKNHMIKIKNKGLKDVFNILFFLNLKDFIIENIGDLIYIKHTFPINLIYVRPYGKYKDFIIPINFDELCVFNSAIDYKFKINKISFSNLSYNQKIQHVRTLATQKGYSLKGFIHDECKTTDRVLLTDGECEWSSIINNIHSTSSPILKKQKSSFGERALIGILNKNKIPYKYQFPFKNKFSTTQYMDFYIEINGRKICLEYNGSQHYRKNNTVFNHKLTVRNDVRKKEYCENNNIEYRVISYKEYTVEKIKEELEKILCIHLDIYKINESNQIFIPKFHKEVMEYYKTHTLKETASHFNISNNSPYNLCKKYGIDIKKKMCSDFASIEVTDLKTNKLHTFETMKNAEDFIKQSDRPFGLKNKRSHLIKTTGKCDFFEKNLFFVEFIPTKLA